MKSVRRVSRILPLLAGHLVGCGYGAKPNETAAAPDASNDTAVTADTADGSHSSRDSAVDTGAADTADAATETTAATRWCGDDVFDSAVYEWLTDDGTSTVGMWDPSALRVPSPPSGDASLWAWTGGVPVEWVDGVTELGQNADPVYLPPLTHRALMPAAPTGYGPLPDPYLMFPAPTPDGISYVAARIAGPSAHRFDPSGYTAGSANGEVDVNGDGTVDVVYAAATGDFPYQSELAWSPGAWFGPRDTPTTNVTRFRCGAVPRHSDDNMLDAVIATPIRGGDVDGDGVDDLMGAYRHTVVSVDIDWWWTASPFVYDMAGLREHGWSGARYAFMERLPPDIPGDDLSSAPELWNWTWGWGQPIVTRDLDGDGLAELAVNGSIFRADLAGGTMEEFPIVDDVPGSPYVDTTMSYDVPTFRPLEEDWNGDGYDDWIMLLDKEWAPYGGTRYRPTSLRFMSGLQRREDGAIHLADAWATVSGQLPFEGAGLLPTIHMASVMPHWWTRPDGTAPDVASQPGFVVSSYGVARIFTPSNLPAGNWDMDDVALTLFDGPTLETSGYADAPPWIGGRAVIDDLDEDGRADVVFGATAADSSYEMRVLYGRTLFEAGAL